MAAATAPRILSAAEGQCPRCGGRLDYYGGTEVRCGACCAAVGPDHPMQRQLDADWRDRRARDKAEADRQAAHPQKVSEYEQTNPLAGVDNEFGRLRQRCDALEKRLAALESRKKA